MPTENQIEAEIQAKGLNAPRLTPAHIDRVIASETYHVFPGTTLTVCALTLKNGFIVTGESAAASPANFDEEIGRKIARDNARAKIWALEGYLLRQLLTVPDMVGATARVCHEVNRAYCAAIGDHSQPAWASAPEWQRESAAKGVRFALGNPSDSHESWLAEKRQAGWKYGPVKDPEAREHPCFVPYDDLPIEQRVKDYLFLAVVRAMAPAAD